MDRTFVLAKVLLTSAIGLTTLFTACGPRPTPLAGQSPTEETNTLAKNGPASSPPPAPISPATEGPVVLHTGSNQPPRLLFQLSPPSRTTTIDSTDSAQEILVNRMESGPPPPPTPIIAMDGTSSGGGGFVRRNAETILGRASQELALAIRNSHPGIYTQFPEDWTSERLASLIERVEIRGHREQRFDEEYLDFNYDLETEIIYATQDFVVSLTALPISSLDEEGLQPYIAEAKLRMLHEAAHFLGIGIAQGTYEEVRESDDKARHFAEQVLEALDSDTLICAAYGFHDKWSRQTMWMDTSEWDAIADDTATVFWAMNLPSQQFSLCTNKKSCRGFIRLMELVENGQVLHRSEYAPFHRRLNSSCAFHNMSISETFTPTKAHYSPESATFYTNWSCDKVSNHFIYEHSPSLPMRTNENFKAYGEEVISILFQNGDVVRAQYQALEYLEPKTVRNSFQGEGDLESALTRQFSFDLDCQRSFPTIQMDLFSS